MNVSGNKLWSRLYPLKQMYVSEDKILIQSVNGNNNNSVDEILIQKVHETHEYFSGKILDQMSTESIKPQWRKTYFKCPQKS